MIPEFSRREKLDSMGVAERVTSISAKPDERAALATRFGLQSIERLDATLSLVKDAAGIRVRGRLGADVTQSCSITGDPVPVTLDEPVDLLFVAEDLVGDEIELSADACDTIVHDGSAVDLGEAVAETMALALDPFPRSAHAEEAIQDAGVLSEGEAGPFAALAGLRAKLKD